MSTSAPARGEREVPAPPEGVWAELAAAVRGEETRPRLEAGVEVRRLDWVRAGPSVLVGRGGTVFSLEAADAAVVELLDGEHTVPEIVAADGVAGQLRPGRVRALIEMLRASGFLEQDSTDVGTELERRLHPDSGRRRALRALRTLSVQWGGADRPIRSLYRHVLRPLFTPLGMVAGAALVLAGTASFVRAALGDRYRFGVQSPGWGFVLLLCLNAAVVAVHELGHGAATVHFGRHVRAAGVRLYYGSPGFFCDVPEALLLTRRQRIAEALAGPYLELLLGSACALGLLAEPGGWLGNTLFRFVVVDWFVLAVNLLPFLELDGYWVLVDLLGIPDLRRRSLRFLRHQLWGRLGHRQRLSAVELGLVGYAVAGIAFTAIELAVAVLAWRRTFGGVVSALWHDGPGGVVLLAVLALVLAAPLEQALAAAARAAVRRGQARARRWRFRIERSWRVEAARCLEDPRLCEDLPVRVLNELAGRVRLVTVSPGDAVVSQGEPADAYYLLRRGRLQVEEEDPSSGESKVLATLSSGEAFGELGLLRHEPRNATVRACEPSELFRLDRGSFERLLLPYLREPALGTTLQELAELAAAPVLAALDRRQLAALASNGTRLAVGPGSDLVTEGEPADGFYVLLEGQAEVRRGGEQVALLSAGAHFGEIALLKGGKRTATVRSLTFVRAFRITPASFDAVLAASPTLGAAPVAGAEAGLAEAGLAEAGLAEAGLAGARRHH